MTYTCVLKRYLLTRGKTGKPRVHNFDFNGSSVVEKVVENCERFRTPLIKSLCLSQMLKDV